MIDRPDDWRAMLFGALNPSKPDISYPYICYVGALPEDRPKQLVKLLINRFINEMVLFL